LIIRQAMYYQRAKLAKNIRWYVSRSLCGEHTSQPILPTFFCNYAECIELHRCVFVSDNAAEELMCFIKEYYQWRTAKCSISCLAKQESADNVK